MEYYIGLDIGTSAVKGALMSENCEVITTSTEAFSYTTEDTMIYLDPEQFVSKMIKIISTLAKAANGGHIASISSCCASGDPILLDENDNPLTPIISWQSTCSWEELNEFWTKKEQEDMYRIVGWDFEETMPNAHFTWLVNHNPEVIKKAKTVTMSCEYFNFLVTGKWGISNSMATPSFLVNQEKAEYEPSYIKKFGMEGKFFPPIMKKGDVLGTVKHEMAEKLCVSTDTKIVLGTFDHPSGALGAGVLSEGDMVISCGTSWVELLPVKDREFALSTGGLVDIFLIDGEEKYCVMMSIDSVGDRINERLKKFFPNNSYAENDEIIRNSKLGCNGLKFDYTSEDYNRAVGFADCDIARAIYEGAAFQLKANLDKLRSFGLKPNRITMAGGITNSKVIMKVISEALGQELQTVNGQQAGAVGSCLLAAIGAGKFKDEKEAFSKFKENN